VGGRGLDRKRFEVLEQWVHGGFQPHLTILFDLDPAVAAARVAATGSAPDRFEREQLGFFERVREAYLARARAEASRFRVIDASAPMGQIRRQVVEAVGSL